MEFVDLDCKVSFDSLDHEILTNGLELITYVGIISFGTPLLLEEFEGLFEDFWGTNDAWVGGGG